MADEIYPSLYRILVPLPGNPLGWINSYVIKGPDRNLIIDTGLNRRECLDALMTGLDEIGVDIEKTDFYITHNHADHYGLVPVLAQSTSSVFIHRLDKEQIEGWTGWDSVTRYAILNGFPQEEVKKAIQSHPGYKYGASLPTKLTPVEDSDKLHYGEYCFTVIATPGHTAGHTCLYDASRRILISGDHVLSDITPNITCWFEGANPLQRYLASLDRVYELPVELVLPGHRRVLEHCKSRIDELKRHHQIRNEEILKVLDHESKSAYEVAASMTWDIDCNTWEEFPPSQKWFATGEALAHLTYLAEAGQLRRSEEKRGVVFSLMQP
ncbi:MAG: MBL fold metallo-hydrolase [Terriglobales bacterium]